MAVHVKKVCDRCSEEVGKLWWVGIVCEPLGTYEERRAYHTIQRRQSAEWCEDCVNKMNVLKPLLRAEEEAKAPTIEDIVRAIVKEEQNQ